MGVPLLIKQSLNLESNADLKLTLNSVGAEMIQQNLALQYPSSMFAVILFRMCECLVGEVAEEFRPKQCI